MTDITYDPDARILNIHLMDGKVHDTDVQKNCIIDYDKKGRILNIEVTEIDFEEMLFKTDE